jgi:hypothetical protein
MLNKFLFYNLYMLTREQEPKPEPERHFVTVSAPSRVSYETSFDSKQPKLEPKLVSKLSETRRLFRINIETGSFGVSIEPKQKEHNRNKPKKC